MPLTSFGSQGVIIKAIMENRWSVPRKSRMIVDDNFLEKNLCHSRDWNHRSPVLRTGALTNQATVTRIPPRKQTSLSNSCLNPSLSLMQHVTVRLRATHKRVFWFWIYLYTVLTSHLRQSYDINIENFYISEDIQMLILRKKLCHSRDTNHISPVLRTGALTNQAIVTRFPTRKQISLSFF